MVDLDKIKQLMEKYNALEKEGRIKDYNEEMTKKDFILPLFKALGWDTENSKEVSAEETIKNKRVDYGFKIDGIPKFFLEAKSLKDDNIINLNYVQQAIDYAWMKSCKWAVLTNFRILVIYNAEERNKDPRLNRFLIFSSPEDYLKDDRIYLLSKESFEEGKLDKEAVKVGKAELKKPVDKALLDDITNFRELLYNSIKNNNPSKGLNEEDIEEAVQRIIDRMIFIRNAEDMGLEPEELRSKIREWSNTNRGKLLEKLSELYKEYDDNYNSKLFAHHLCDDLKIDDDVLNTVINGLYESKDGLYRYDFSLLSADILGNIYEQYLGRILKKVGKNSKLEASKTKRKSEGIYYTPTYIVDYIIKNTVGEYIKTHKEKDIDNIKILDPACGSGSFLLKAYDVLENYWKEKRKLDEGRLEDFGSYSKKVDIVTKNIFGVDLDEKAVEIAQLNLLLKIAEKRKRLPKLQENIKNGNSLINDKKVSDKAFNWKEEFKEIVSEGGFDIIIGNPPYVRVQNLNYSEIDYLKNNYDSAFQRTDLYLMFYEKALKLLNEGGRLGFISSIQFINSEYGRGLRKILLNNRIIEIIDFGDLPVFSDAINYTGIFIIEKGKPKDFWYVKIDSLDNIELKIKTAKRAKIAINKLSENEWVFASNKLKDILEKMHDNLKLSDISLINTGCFTGKDKAYFIDDETIRSENLEKDIIKPVILGKEPKRYILNPPKRKAIYPYRLVNGKTQIIDERNLEKSYPNIFNHLKRYKKDLLNRKDSRVSFSEKKIPWYSYTRKGLLDVFNKEKLIVGYIANTNNFCIDEQHYIFGVGRAFGIVLNSKEIDLNYLLGVLCSKLYYFLMKKECPIKKGGFFKISSDYLNNLPIKKIPLSEQKQLSNLVKEMLLSKSKLKDLKNKQIDERVKIEEEIQKTDKEIDELVYKIYGITDEEKKIIEESLK